MKSILEELFYGNVGQNAGCRDASAEEQQLMEYLLVHHAELKKTLTDKQKAIDRKYHQRLISAPPTENVDCRAGACSRHIPRISPCGEYSHACRRLASGRRSARRMRTGLCALWRTEPSALRQWRLQNKKRTLLGAFRSGGATQNRTGGEGFADLCLTAWLWRHIVKQEITHRYLLFLLERITGLEPATSTLARWRSTK